MSVAVPGHDPILFDLGTGVRYFGLQYPTDRAFTGTCFLTHLHWDHVQGLPFFTPLLRPGGHLTVYGPVQEDGRSLRDVVDTCLCPPMFPVGIDALPGVVDFNGVGDDTVMIGEVEVMTRLIPHVGNTCGYRLSWGGATVAYLSDHQQPCGERYEMSDGARELCEGADLLIHDAQYTVDEMTRFASFGHASGEYPIELARRCDVPNVLLFHHDPSRTDEAVEALEQQLQGDGPPHVVAAREGMTITLPTV